MQRGKRTRARKPIKTTQCKRHAKGKGNRCRKLWESVQCKAQNQNRGLAACIGVIACIRGGKTRKSGKWNQIVALKPSSAICKCWMQLWPTSNVGRRTRGRPTQTDGKQKPCNLENMHSSYMNAMKMQWSSRIHAEQSRQLRQQTRSNLRAACKHRT